jgi:hypothetical protein
MIENENVQRKASEPSPTEEQADNNTEQVVTIENGATQAKELPLPKLGDNPRTGR